MTDKEFTNKIHGAMEKCFNAMTQYEASSAEFTRALDNLSNLYFMSPSLHAVTVPEEPEPVKEKKTKSKAKVEEPYVEEPPFEVEPVAEEAPATTVDYKALRVDLQKQLSQARRDHGINPKDLVQKYAESFKLVADEDLPKLSNDLQEALANA